MVKKEIKRGSALSAVIDNDIRHHSGQNLLWTHPLLSHRNLRSGPFLASLICSLMSSLAKIGPDQKSLKNSVLADQTRDLIGY